MSEPAPTGPDGFRDKDSVRVRVQPPYAPHIGYKPEMVEGLRGKRVRVPAGVPVRSTHPQVKGWQRTKRAQTVRVDHVLSGSEDGWENVISDPSVRWPGAGGYWREVPVEFIEVSP
jgi:hypothetical protein